LYLRSTFLWYVGEGEGDEEGDVEEKGVWSGSLRIGRF